MPDLIVKNDKYFVLTSNCIFSRRLQSKLLILSKSQLPLPIPSCEPLGGTGQQCCLLPSPDTMNKTSRFNLYLAVIAGTSSFHFQQLSASISSRELFNHSSHNSHNRFHWRNCCNFHNNKVNYLVRLSTMASYSIVFAYQWDEIFRNWALFINIKTLLIYCVKKIGKSNFTLTTLSIII